MGRAHKHWQVRRLEGLEEVRRGLKHWLSFVANSRVRKLSRLTIHFPQPTQTQPNSNKSQDFPRMEMDTGEPFELSLWYLPLNFLHSFRSQGASEYRSRWPR